jgi:hypothetical protein
VWCQQLPRHPARTQEKEEEEKALTMCPQPECRNPGRRTSVRGPHLPLRP